MINYKNYNIQIEENKIKAIQNSISLLNKELNKKISINEYIDLSREIDNLELKLECMKNYISGNWNKTFNESTIILFNK